MTALYTALRTLAAGKGDENSGGGDVYQTARAAGLRVLAVRVLGHRWWLRRSGPLLARNPASSKWLALLPAAGGGLAAHTGQLREAVLDSEQAKQLGDLVYLPYLRWPVWCAHPRDWLALARPRHRSLVSRWLLPAGASILPVMPALAVLLLGTEPQSPPAALLALLACLTLGGICARWAASLHELGFGRDASLGLHGLLWDRLLTADPRNLWRFPAAMVASRLRDALIAGQRELETAYRLREAGIGLAAALAILATAGPRLSALYAVELLAGFAVLSQLWGRVGQAAVRAGEQMIALDRDTAESGALPVYRSLRASRWLLARIAGAFRNSLKSGLTVAEAVIATRAGFQVLLLLQLVTGAAVSAAGLVTLSNLAVMLLAVFAATDQVYRIAAITGTRTARQARMAAVMPALGVGAGDAGDPPLAVPGRFELLTLDAVWFGYSPAIPVLRGIDLHIGRGDVIAITGASGSGRTTLLRVMAGILHPDSGRLRVNGQDPAVPGQPDFRDRVGIIAHEEELPAGSIRSAILGSELPEEAAEEEAISASGLRAAAERLPMGLQTLIVPGALSRGMTQQIKLARALARSPDLLLLDDALSALPSEAVRSVLNELRRRGMTVILAAPGASLQAMADRSLHLQAGRIIR